MTSANAIMISCVDKRLVHIEQQVRGNLGGLEPYNVRVAGGPNGLSRKSALSEVQATAHVIEELTGLSPQIYVLVSHRNCGDHRVTNGEFVSHGDEEQRLFQSHAEAEQMLRSEFGDVRVIHFIVSNNPVRDVLHNWEKQRVS